MNIPEELERRAQWVTWRYEERDGKATKIPLCANGGGGRASTTDPQSWATFEEATSKAEDGRVGFVFDADDPYVGIDLDGCINEHGEMHPIAKEIVKQIDGYAEISPSGAGVKIIAKGEWRSRRNRTADVPWRDWTSERGGGIEIYDRARFFTLSGKRCKGEPRKAQDALDTLRDRFLPKLEPVQTMRTSTVSDAQVLEKAFSAKNGSDVRALYGGALNGHPSASEAQLALLGHLRFWTQDPSQLERIVSGSALATEKWVQRADYRQRTIERALQGGGETYDWGTNYPSQASHPDAHGISDATDATDRSDPPADVDGAELLEEIRAYLLRYMVLPSDEIADFLALWVEHTHCFDAAPATPYPRIVSAAPDSGKSTLLEVLAAMVRRPWLTIDPSAAVLYRMIDQRTPALLLDEMDNYPLDKRRSALAVLNAGYRRGARIPRCNDRGNIEEFNCFCPKAYAGLDTKSIAPALLSRSVTLRLEPKKASETVEPWMGSLTAALAAPIRDKCAAWAHHHVEALKPARPHLPEHLRNRSAEVWWALLAIADAVGGDWSRRARQVSKSLGAGGDYYDEKPDLVLLLSDIQTAFDGAETISTETLLAKLNEDEESPWGARRRGEGIDARGLARMLRPLGIRPRTVRVPGETATSRGYRHEQFIDAFGRYLNYPTQAAQATHPNAHGIRDVSDVSDVSEKTGIPQTLIDSGIKGQTLICSCADGGEGDGERCTRCWGYRR